MDSENEFPYAVNSRHVAKCAADQTVNCGTQQRGLTRPCKKCTDFQDSPNFFFFSQQVFQASEV